MTFNPRTRHATILQSRKARVGLAAAALLILSACGGGPGGDAPDDASTDDFCEAFISGQDSKTGGDVKDYAERLADVGTPDGIGDDERKGFEVYVDALNDVDEDAAIEDIEDTEVSEDDEADGEAFLGYAAETCADALAPSE